MDANLFELAQNKLLILYIVKKFNHQLHENDLSYFVLNMELFNYFYFKQYIRELESSGLILFDDEHKYYLSSDGEEALELFLETLPQETTTLLDEEMDHFSLDLKRRNSIIAKVEEKDENYYALLEIIDGNVKVLHLRLETSNRNMAEKICQNFKNNPQIIYKDLLQLLLQEKKDDED
ncbi:MAG: DUF4364 family protein [Tissierellia bacterium]|nr:DUF4364 family protein [Tissierellia bacterium]